MNYWNVDAESINWNFNQKPCQVCKKVIFVREGAVAICDNCWAHRNDEPC